MKCFRARLSERRETSAHVARREPSAAVTSPRHYCQRRMADSTHDEREWLRRFTPERFHLAETEGDSGSATPLSVSETPEMIEIKTPKNVFRPAFLTVTDLALHADTPASGTTTRPKRRVKYKTVPKHCSGHMHRMFVKNSVDNEEDRTRASSRASTEYERFAFEEYIALSLEDDSSEISLFRAESETRFVRPDESEPSNNNDSRFKNKNNDKVAVKRNAAFFKSTPNQKKKEVDKVNISTQNSRKNESENDDRGGVPPQGSHKKERRKSITISRIPSPETVQIIRIDVISGYPVDNDSLLSELTDSDVQVSEEASHLDFSSSAQQPDDSRRAEMKYHLWKNIFNDVNCAQIQEKDFKDHCPLLNCKSLNLSSRN